MLSLIEEYLEYQNIYQKKYGKDTIVFMEVGSFYEIYEVNGLGKASETSSILNILLTKKNKNIKEISLKNPLMAGIPTISLSKHLATISALNKYTIIKIDQVSKPPNVTRKVTEVISPGTLLRAQSSQNNYLFSCFFEKFDMYHMGIGISIIDVSTGRIMVYQSLSSLDNRDKPIQDLSRFIIKYSPSEVALTFQDFTLPEQKVILNTLPELPIQTTSSYSSSNYKISYINEILNELYDNKTMLSGVENLGLENLQIATNSLIGLILFLNDHNPLILKHILKPSIISEDNELILTNNSLYQLDIINSRIKREDRGSLFGFYDKTITAPGSRLLKDRLTKPSTIIKELNRRYKMVDYFLVNDLYSTIREQLSGTLDLERLFRKVSIGNIDPIEIYAIYTSLLNISSILPLIHNNIYIFQNYTSTALNSMILSIKSIFIIENLDLYIQTGITGNIFHPEINHEISNQFNLLNKLNKKLDTIRDSFNMNFSTKAIIEHTDKEGHFLSITNSQLNQNSFDSSTYTIRKQSTRSKLFTINISSLSDEILIVNQKIINLNKDEFVKQVGVLHSLFSNDVIKIIADLSELDVSCNTAYISTKYNYFKPTIQKSTSSTLSCLDLRHPIVEQLSSTDFVPNDIILNEDNMGKLIFGVNATGKSTLLKATGIAVIMAQAGLFVSCRMKFSPFNSLFTRITSNDNIFKNQSTFTVEMLELKLILEQASANSLVLADELSHGTETNSGVAILSTCIDFLTNVGSKFLFTTHLHQVSNISIIKNNRFISLEHLSVEYNESDQYIVYNRRLEPGSGDSIYGLVVAKGLGLDGDFIAKANSVLLEVNESASNLNNILTNTQNRYNCSKINVNCELCGAPAIDTHHIEYRSEADHRNFTKSGYVNRKTNLLSVCGACHIDIHNGKIIDIKYKSTTSGIVLVFSIKE